MDAATVALLVIVGVIVAAIALHLIAIAATLNKIAGTLTKLKGGVVAIEGQTDPVTTVVTGLAGDVAAIDNDLVGLLEVVEDAQAAAAAAAPAPPPPKPSPRPAARRSGRSRTAPAAVAVLDQPEGVDALVDFEDEAAAPRRPSMAEAVARARTGG